jgi:hypothetical protein
MLGRRLAEYVTDGVTVGDPAASTAR